MTREKPIILLLAPGHSIGHSCLYESSRNALIAGDEALLVRELSKGSLYRMLAKAEGSLGMVGRPEASDNIDEIWTVLQELAKRSSSPA